MSNQNNYAYAPYQVYEAENSPNLRAVLMRYARHWKWFLFSLALAGAGAYVYFMYQTPIYKVQTSLLIKDDKKGLSEDNILKEMDIFAPKKVVENEMEILKSYALMSKVVGELGLDVQYFRNTNFGKREIYDASPIRLIVERSTPLLYETPLDITATGSKAVRINDKIYPVNQSIQTPYGRLRVFASRPLKIGSEPIVVQALPRQVAVDSYLKRLTVETTSKASTVLQMNLEEAVPRKGEAVLNKLISEYNQAAVVDKNIVASNTLSFIEERLRLIAGELSTVEKGVEQFKSSEGITDLSSQAQVFLATVKQNDDQLNQTNIQLGMIEDVERYVNSRTNERGVAPATLSVSDPILVGLVGKLSELELQRDQLSRTTTASNPILQTLESQIKATKTSLSENITNMKQTLVGTRQKMRETNRQLEGQIRTIPRKERALVNITRQQSIKNNLYTYLLEKREETALSYASTVADSRTIDPPRSDNKPIKPVKATIFLLFGLIGLMFPIGVIAARDALNDRVSRRSDIEDASQVPILGEIMASRNMDPLVMVSGKRSVIAEQIRTLRTNLQFLRSNPTDSQVVMFTSSISGEGKSFLSLNLGASLALVDRTTVILEMDLRKPKLHSVLGMSNALGISNYLIQEATLDEVLQPIPGFPNYHIITCGPIPPNPAELLSSPQLEKLFMELRQRFAYVIVDSPPIGLVTDAQLIAPHVDATMFMVRHDHTPKAYLRMIDNLYKEHRFQRLNLILNGVGSGESYQYGYSYNYGGYYEEDNKPAKTTIRKLKQS
ncbi:GumC family protein [Spirosoma utsteinense]|uniref:Capsular exopolysaccharide synthesis family protein n=1 Tax=Spirosoma utsteinense TaxID=2585773 RepID=A0ABR6W8Y1_9BACT|nr:tyrosine-protein kinase [Spirosoma utsteinense]MBC3787404.1 capsular exopolysaccharide synthesis family protein [Spirosoma utsteinense]MBC3793041.1 capsular exopolysaccharide synthesis family protein [Spirosoma utsteinense]